MSTKRWTWASNALGGRPMEVAVWGEVGKPVLLFPTAAADCYDVERFHLIRVLEPLIAAGRIKVYSCGSVAGDAWLDFDAHPAHKAWLQARYDDYLLFELLPHIREDCGGYSNFVATGASLGAYNAVTVAAKHPDWFDLVIAMSGTYDFDRWMHGHRDSNYYFNQPMYFLPNVSDDAQLNALRRTRFVLASGAGRAEAPWESERLAGIMRSKGIPVDLELWGPDVHHDWPTWRTMLPMFLDKLT